MRALDRRNPDRWKTKSVTKTDNRREGDVGPYLMILLYLLFLFQINNNLEG